MSTLTGRGPELRQIAAALERADGGRPAVVAIEGEPGIGKSRLLDEALTGARASGWITLECRCGPFDEDRPFVPLLAGLDDLIAEHEGVLPVELIDSIGQLRKASSPHFGNAEVGAAEVQGHRLAAVLVEGLHELARFQRLLVVFDDCQWIDDASAHVLWGVVRRRRLSRLVVLTSFRPEQATYNRAPVTRLRRSLDSQEAAWISLGPLTPAESRDLAADVLGHKVSAAGLRLLDDAAGNPLFITELLRAGDPGEPNDNHGLGDTPDRSIPESLRRIVLRRVGELPESTQAVLRTAAVSGPQVELAELALVHGGDQEAVLNLLVPAIAQRLLVERGTEFVFQHAIVQGIIAESEPVRARQLRHLAIAVQLTDSSIRPERIAEHYWRAEVHGNLDGIACMTKAAKMVRPLSLEASLTWLQRALESCSDAIKCVDLRLEIAALLILLGRGMEAEAICELLKGEPAEFEAQVRLRFTLASLSSMAGTVRNEEAQSHIQWILDRVSSQDPRRVELLGWKAMLLIFAGDVRGAGEAAETALTIPTRDRWPDSRSRAYEARAFVRLFTGDLGGAQSDARSATDLFASDQRAFTSLMLPHFTRAMTTLVTEPVSRVREVLEAGFEVCDRAGHDLARLHLEPLMAVTYFVEGGFAEARRVIDAVFSRGNDWRAAGITMPTATGLSGVLAMLDGDDEAALRLADHGLEELQVGGSQAGSADFAVWCIAVVREARGEASVAQFLLEAVWNLVARHASLLTTAPDLVRLSFDSKPEFAADVTKIATRRALKSGGLLDRASAAACVGYLERDVVKLDEAAVLYDQLEWHFPALRVRWFAAKIDPVSARWVDVLHRVRDLESPWLIERCEADAPSEFCAAAKEPVTGPGLLSRAERVVVELVAQGMSNREIAARLIVSHRTVDSHVSHALAKLQLNSRLQLALWFAEKGSR